ncbi:MAG TPA: VOC family protein [Polyangiaceae bacterium]|nr:VOC family protein [Polyangiaceae bacterium]
MKPTPPGWPRASSSLGYERAAEAIDWLGRAFGFEVHTKILGKDGRIEHSELTFGGAVFMVSDPKPDKFDERRAPSQIGGVNTQSIFVYVDDVEAHCARARAAGAKIVHELTTTDYGDGYWVDRGYGCLDLGGHSWYFAERVSTSPEQVKVSAR